MTPRCARRVGPRRSLRSARFLRDERGQQARLRDRTAENGELGVRQAGSVTLRASGIESLLSQNGPIVHEISGVEGLISRVGPIIREAAGIEGLLSHTSGR